MSEKTKIYNTRKGGMNLNPLKLKDKKLFNKYLKFKNHELSNYSFINIFIWKKLFKIYWKIINGNLCIFFKDNFGYFMYLPPLGKNISPETIKKCFWIMNKLNINKDVSRIENVEEEGIGLYQKLGYKFFPKDKEYLCKVNKLIDLKGNKFKSKRSSYNFFIKNYRYKLLKYKDTLEKKVLNLHFNWQKNRRGNSSDNIYQDLLQDTTYYLEVALKYFKKLGLIGYCVEIDNKIEAFTCGFKINQEIFCVLFEITNLEIKGLSSFIFREFAKKLKNFKTLNIMDDSGLYNLRVTKLSYRPFQGVNSFIINQNA